RKATESRSCHVDIPDHYGQHLTVGPAADEVLDNAVWHSLSGGHAGLAEGTGRARRYPPELSVFGGVDTLDAGGWAALAGLVGRGGGAVLFGRAVPSEAPAGWRIAGRGVGTQFVAWSLADIDQDGAPPIVDLGPDDAERMLALARLTRPGPFALRTSE